MTTNVLFLLDSLSPVGGAERVAVKIALSIKNSGNYLPFICSTRAGGSLEEVLRINNIDYLILNRTRAFEIHKFKLLINLIKERNIKIIHSHNLGSNFWGAIMGYFLKVPIIIAHKHGQDYGKWKSRTIDKIVSDLSQKIIFVSNYERDMFLNKIGASPDKCITVYNGIDIDNIDYKSKVDVRHRYGVKEEDVVVGIIARFAPEKNHETFLLAAQEVLKIHRDVTFVLVGEGKTRRTIQKFSSELGITEHTIFTGYIEEISDILPILDIGCLTSTREGMGIALLEYMAYHIPIVASNVGGIPEVVQDGKNGFLIKPGDYKTMADKINRFIDDDNLRKQMGREGFCILKNKFTESVMTNAIVKLYDLSLKSIGEV